MIKDSEKNLNLVQKIIKPVFLPWVVLFYYLPLQLNLTLVGGGVGGGIGFLIILYFGLDLPVWYPLFFTLGFFFIGTPLMIYYVGSRTYEVSAYKFYPNYLEYTEGFWTIEHKVIQYQHITQIYLRKNIIQRLYGLGTIYLSVPSLSQKNNIPGIQLRDISQPDEVYKEILKIVSDYR